MLDGHDFEAYIFETFGALGSEAEARIRALAARVQEEAEPLGDRYAGARFTQRWLQRLGVRLQRGNALALVRRARADMHRYAGQQGRPWHFDDMVGS